MYQHFKAVHDATDIPIMIYNIPGRCVVDMDPPTMGRLAELPRIVGVKDSTNDIKRPFKTREACGEDFVQMSGEDPTVMPFLSMGGHGCISVTCNVAPGLLAEMHDAWRAGNVERAQEINDLLMPLHAAMFAEPSPAPAKYGASLLGLADARVRLPIVTLSDGAKQQVRAAMSQAGLLS
jgi:4-hydroxy-tetrahydrodipicolinate synthase